MRRVFPVLQLKVTKQTRSSSVELPWSFRVGTKTFFFLFSTSRHSTIVGCRNKWGFVKLQPSILKSNKTGVAGRAHADSLENNISEDSRSQPSLKDLVINTPNSHRNRRPVIWCSSSSTNIWVYTSAVNQNYSTLAASELEVLYDRGMFLCIGLLFIAFITFFFLKFSATKNFWWCSTSEFFWEWGVGVIYP